MKASGLEARHVLSSSLLVLLGSVGSAGRASGLCMSWFGGGGLNSVTQNPQREPWFRRYLHQQELRTVGRMVPVSWYSDRNLL